MNLTERLAYIKGLCNGLELDESKPEVKVINAIIEMLDEVAFEVSEQNEVIDELGDTLDAIDEDLDVLFDEDCDCCDCCDDDEDEDEENPYYEVTCQHCGEKFTVSEDVLIYGEFPCPECGEINEYDFSDLFEMEDDCDGCDCGCHEH